MRPPEAITAEDLVPMDLFEGSEPLLIDLVYADTTHPENIFGMAPYGEGARLSLHKDLAAIVLLTARHLQESHGWTLVLKDGLRTTDAQEKLINTDIVRANPHWLQEPRLLSSPGMGAHPRGMAIDVSVLDENRRPVDMGTVFDDMVPESARSFMGFDPDILANRRQLEQAFLIAAARLGLPLLGLPSEWWDYRIPADLHKAYTPLSDNDLPGPLRMCSPQPDASWEPRFAALAKAIVLSL